MPPKLEHRKFNDKRNDETKKQFLAKVTDDRERMIKAANEFDGGEGLIAYTDGGYGKDAGVAGWGFVVSKQKRRCLGGQLKTNSHEWAGRTMDV